jgi:hypothetical protein
MPKGGISHMTNGWRNSMQTLELIKMQILKLGVILPGSRQMTSISVI